MAVPWLRLIDAAIGVGDVVRRANARSAAADERAAAPALSSMLSGIEAKLAGVVVAALQEAFDRDHQRLELEREQIDAERQRAERALRLELRRQAGDREIGRMRLVAGVALASWLGTLLLAPTLLQGTPGRVALGVGWLLLLLALSGAFAEQSRLSRALAGADERTPSDSIAPAGIGGAAAPWLVVSGLAAAALGVLIS
ncbi:MAG: hypothetical protein AB7Q29_15675 [Vicinamibacterales bacterium]